MKRLLRCSPFVFTLSVYLCLLLLSTGCAQTESEGFAIYLTKDDVSPSHLSVLSHVDIEEEPLIGINDIITYNAGTHEITLTSDAYKRIVDLEVPVGGRSFMVCVDKQPVYSGAFWVAFSSMSFDGITI